MTVKDLTPKLLCLSGLGLTESQVVQLSPKAHLMHFNALKSLQVHVLI